MTTLNLPPLAHQEARNVEEALIAHFGPDGEGHNNNRLLTGQLDNKRHEIDPKRVAYCERLLVGQFVLDFHAYGSYAAAYFTKNTDCPGIGGAR
jgi:hypothetical protein